MAPPFSTACSCPVSPDRTAVAADRARVAADLDDFLRDRISAMAAAAAAAQLQ
jgi:hypothetical protein